MLNQKTYLMCFLAAVCFSAGLVPLVERFARGRRLMERPNARKPAAGALHPLAGGLAVFLATWLPIALLLLHENVIVHKLREDHGNLLALLLAGLGAMLLGLYDDARGANAREKLAVQGAIAVGLFFIAGIKIEVLRIPFLGEIGFNPAVSFLITALWVIGITNALNLIDGIDGLAAGVALFAALATGLVNGIGGDPFLAVTMLSLAGALAGFLRYNFHPARIFLGDTGSMFLGMTLAVAALETSTKRTVAVSIFVPIATLAYPILDTSIAVVRRWLRGRPFWSADRQHIHHRLLARGLSTPRAAVTIWGVSVLFGVIAVGLVLESALAVTISLVAVTLVLHFGARRLGLMDLLARIPREEKRQLTRLRLYTEYAMARLADEPDAIEELLRTAAQEAGARVTIGDGLPRGEIVAAEGTRWLSVEFETGTAVYREEALAHLLKLAFHGKAANRILDARAQQAPAPPAPSDVAPPPMSSSSSDDAERDNTPTRGVRTVTR